MAKTMTHWFDVALCTIDERDNRCAKPELRKACADLDIKTDGLPDHHEMIAVKNGSSWVEIGNIFSHNDNGYEYTKSATRYYAHPNGRAKIVWIDEVYDVDMDGKRTYSHTIRTSRKYGRGHWGVATQTAQVCHNGVKIIPIRMIVEVVGHLAALPSLDRDQAYLLECAKGRFFP